MAARGVDVIGIDASSAMLEIARKAHPHIRFEEGLLTDLSVPPGSLAGAVCWYSIIHTPAEHLDAVSTELLRVLAAGGYVLIAFQAGTGEPVHRSEVHGTAVSLTSYRHAPDEVARRFTAAGLQVCASALREPESAHESTPQAFMLCRSPKSV